MGVLEEECMGMINAINPDELRDSIPACSQQHFWLAGRAVTNWSGT